MTKQHIIVKDDEPKGRKVYQTFKEDEADIAEEILESAEIAELPVRKFTVYTNNDIPKRK